MFICLNSQHCCRHAYSFKPIPYFRHFSRIYPAYIHNLHTPIHRTKSRFQYKKFVQPGIGIGIGIDAADSMEHQQNCLHFSVWKWRWPNADAVCPWWLWPVIYIVECSIGSRWPHVANASPLHRGVSVSNQFALKWWFNTTGNLSFISHITLFALNTINCAAVFTISQSGATSHTTIHKVI